MSPIYAFVSSLRLGPLTSVLILPSDCVSQLGPSTLLYQEGEGPEPLNREQCGRLGNGSWQGILVQLFGHILA